MKKTAFVLVILALVSNLAFAQYIEVPKENPAKLKTSSGLILGFINPKNFAIQHSFNMSYGSYGGANVSLASYTATLSYKVRDNLKVSADISMQYSPYASIGSNRLENQAFQNSFNGINLSRVSLDYQPFKNMYISFNYINMKNNPLGYYGYGPYGYGPYSRYSGYYGY